MIKTDLQCQVQHLSMGPGYINSSIYSASASPSSSQSGTPTHWIFASGASCHMTSDASLLTTINTRISFPRVHTMDGSNLNITRCGMITQTTKHSRRMSLTKVFVEPSLSLNLISISSICMSGLTITFSSTSCCAGSMHWQDTLCSL